MGVFLWSDKVAEPWYYFVYMESIENVEKSIVPEVSPEKPLQIDRVYLFGASFEDSERETWVLNTDTRLLARLEDTYEEEQNIFYGKEDDNPVIGFNAVEGVKINKFDDLQYAVNYVLEIVYEKLAKNLWLREKDNLSMSTVPASDRYVESSIEGPYYGWDEKTRSFRWDENTHNKELIASRAMTISLDRIVGLLKKMREEYDKRKMNQTELPTSEVSDVDTQFNELQNLYAIYDQARVELGRMRKPKR